MLNLRSTNEQLLRLPLELAPPSPSPWAALLSAGERHWAPPETPLYVEQEEEVKSLSLVSETFRPTFPNLKIISYI